jgi:hypothetical protein
LPHRNALVTQLKYPAASDGVRLIVWSIACWWWKV